jgi:hypothetical protein
MKQKENNHKGKLTIALYYGLFSRSHKRSARLCIKVEKKFDTTRLRAP